MHILFVLQTAFSIWMLVDAIRRGASQYWWFIVMVPFGEVAYFIAVVWPDLRRNGVMKALFVRPPSLEQVRQDFAESPSEKNRLRLAQALHDHGEFQEAGRLFEDALDRDPADRDALYGFAQCALETGHRDAAIGALETLVHLDSGFRDSSPCFELADLYWDTDRKEDALSLAEQLCRSSQRIGPRALLAGFLVESGRSGEARDLLTAGLEVYASSPRAVQRRDRDDAAVAKSLLQKVR